MVAMLNKRLLAGVGLFALMTFAAGIALADPSAVTVAKKDGVGSYLADGKGMTLYTFKKDAPGMSACEGPCVEKWPLFHDENVAAGAGLNAKDFGSIIRPDGKKQTTYKGMPLYYYAGDKNPGDTGGQGARDVWYAAVP